MFFKYEIQLHIPASLNICLKQKYTGKSVYSHPFCTNTKCKVLEFDCKLKQTEVAFKNAFSPFHIHYLDQEE